MVNRAKLGDRVRVQYLGLLNDGSMAQKHRGRHVLQFRVGSKKVISGISLGVVGMAEGETKRFTLQPRQAYGAVRSDLIREIPRQRFPSTLDLCVGKWLTSGNRNSNHRRRVQITEVKPAAVTVDGNHPLAGKVLEVEVQLVSLDSPSVNVHDDSNEDWSPD
jgi:peptidylprolyl isomerase